MVIGVLGFLFLCVFLIAHFFFGEPVLNKNTGQNMSDQDILLTFGLMSSAFGLFAFLGAWILFNPDSPPIKAFFRLAAFFSPPWFR